MAKLRLGTILVVATLAGCGDDDGAGNADAGAPDAADAAVTTDAALDGAADGAAVDAAGPVRVPLTDLGTGTYLGFEGGLYPGGSNFPPPAFRTVALARANAIQPRDTAGQPSATGKIVLLSVGMSNATQEWCSTSSALPCDAWTLTGKATADVAVDKTRLSLVNGAMGGQTTDLWDEPTDVNYDRVRDQRLQPLGLTEAQVQAVWFKVVHGQPRSSLPAADADARTLAVDIAEAARALKVRYPNLQLVFFSSRIYGGWATTTLNPEPYAYETGFAAKWAISAQIAQAAGGPVDALYGDLAVGTAAPVMLWGPYLWADGLNPRGDGLTWPRNNFEGDGTHPTMAGESKVADQLLMFFKNSPVTKCWFLTAGSCP